MHWLTWRKRVREVNSDNVSNVAKAESMLKELKAIMPENQIVDSTLPNYDDRLQHIEGKLRNVTFLERQVASLRETIENEEVEIVDVEPHTDEFPTNLPDARSFLLGALDMWHCNQTNNLSSSTMSVIFERCEQAIDYKITKNVERNPMVIIASKEYGLSVSEIVEMFINDKKVFMKSLYTLEELYWKIRKKVETIDEVKALEQLYTLYPNIFV